MMVLTPCSGSWPLKPLATLLSPAMANMKSLALVVVAMTEALPPDAPVFFRGLAVRLGSKIVPATVFAPDIPKQTREAKVLLAHETVITSALRVPDAVV